jgi:hypothetical protein
MSDLKLIAEQEARALFDQKRWLDKKRTIAVFDALGRQLGFTVSGEGCGDGEWLYDLSWSETAERTGGGYYMKAQRLVLESEATPDSILDGDFQKLVQARADVRIWIAKVHSKQSVGDHVAEFMEQIRRFAGTQPDDTYVFMIYDTKENAAFFECFRADNLG